MKQTKKNETGELKFAILATDAVIFTVEDNALKVALVNINVLPYFKNIFALPGGLILPKETADDSVYRHIKDKVGIKVEYIEQLYTFSSVKRDPRGRVVSVAYMCFVPSENIQKAKLKEGIIWKDIKNLPKLAYDHNDMVKKAIERLRAKLQYTTLVRFFLNKNFTLPEFQKIYEIIFQKVYDKRNFRKKIQEFGFLKKTGLQKREGSHRPADLYIFAVGKDKLFDIL